MKLYSQLYLNQEKIQSNDTSRTTATRPTTHTAQAQAQTQGDDLMDLDRIKIRIQVTPLERAYRENKGLCRRCGAQGHFAIDYTREKAKGSNRTYNLADRELGDKGGTVANRDTTNRGGF